MLVGIDVSSAVTGGRTGVGNFTAGLVGGLRRLAMREPGVDLALFSNRYAADAGEAELAADDVYPLDRQRYRTLWLQWGILRSINRLRPDICHFPNHLAPVHGLRRPFVVTMHDMSIYRCPGHQPAKTVAVHRTLVPLVARRASLILTDSQSARQDILSHLRVPEDRVRVVYAGVHRRFGEVSPGQVTAARRRYGLHQPYVLGVGTLEPRKNHVNLIDAYTWLVEQERLPHHLVIAGGRGWQQQAIWQHARRSSARHRIHFLGYVPDNDLPGLYTGASAFAFPSFYEGFGLPVLEALACGVPTLISTDPALTEVAGEGTTVSVDPSSVQDMAAGLWGLLSDADLVAGLQARGRLRAREFSWDRCAAETVRLYREVMGQHRSVKASAAQ